MQGLNLGHHALFSSSLLIKEKLEWVEGFLQENEEMGSKGRVPTRLSCQTNFCHLLSAFLALGPELISTVDGRELPVSASRMRWSMSLHICGSRD